VKNIWLPERGVVYLSIIKVMNTDMLTHHFARLEMMMAEEKGIDLSYEDAIKLVQSQK